MVQYNVQKWSENLKKCNDPKKMPKKMERIIELYFISLNMCDIWIAKRWIGIMSELIRRVSLLCLQIK